MELIKAYHNLTIYGRAVAIIAAWSTHDKLYHEWFLHFESSKPERRASRRMETDKNGWNEIQQLLNKPINEEELLGTFLDEGLRMAQGELYSILNEYALESKSIYPVNVELQEQANYIGHIMNLKRKFPAYLDWIEKNTQQKELKKVIKIAKGIHFTDLP